MTTTCPTSPMSAHLSDRDRPYDRTNRLGRASGSGYFREERNSHGSGQYPEQPPWVGHAPELVHPAILEAEPRAGHQILDGAGDEHLPRLGLGRHALPDVDGDA